MDLPDDRQAIENKWIFKKKTDADGNITIYKARLVMNVFDKFKELTMMRPSSKPCWPSKRGAFCKSRPLFVLGFLSVSKPADLG